MVSVDLFDRIFPRVPEYVNRYVDFSALILRSRREYGFDYQIVGNESLKIFFDMPGFTEHNVKIFVERNRVKVIGEKEKGFDTSKGCGGRSSFNMP